MTGPLAYGLQSARVLGQLQYSRHAEAEADDEGMKMLLAARVDPAGMIGFFEGLTPSEKQPRTVLKYLSTHPSPSDRVEHLKALATHAAEPPLKLLPGEVWSDIKTMCRTAGQPSPAVPRRPPEPSRSTDRK
jgi:predicted Zn-dependent protease